MSPAPSSGTLRDQVAKSAHEVRFFDFAIVFCCLILLGRALGRALTMSYRSRIATVVVGRPEEPGLQRLL